MVNKRYYEKLGGFSHPLNELKSKIGSQQTDILINDAVIFCNELCKKYKYLSKKEKLHTEKMIFPRVAIYMQMIKYISSDEAISLIEEAVRIGEEPDRKRLHFVTKLPFIQSLFFKIFPKMINTMFNEDSGFKTIELKSDNNNYKVDVLQCPYMKYCELLNCKELTTTLLSV